MYNALEKKVIKTILEYDLLNTNMILAVSGGLDSMALLKIMHHISKKFPITIAVAHFHHGGISSYRKNAYLHVKKQTALYDFEFFYKKHKTTLKTETECRRERLKFLKSIAKREKALIVTAHHMEDLLETRILRLIRGVGANGLVSMRIMDNNIFRPLLNFSKDELLKFKPKFLEDPSNKDNSNIRNWVRNVWLNALKTKAPKASKNMHRSLDLISNAKRLDLSFCITKDGLDRHTMSLFSIDLRHEAIAKYMLLKNIKNYSHSQIHEIEKRLRSKTKNFKFKVAKRLWLVNTTHVRLKVSARTESCPAL